MFTYNLEIVMIDSSVQVPVVGTLPYTTELDSYLAVLIGMGVVSLAIVFIAITYRASKKSSAIFNSMLPALVILFYGISFLYNHTGMYTITPIIGCVVGLHVILIGIALWVMLRPTLTSIGRSYTKLGSLSLFGLCVIVTCSIISVVDISANYTIPILITATVIAWSTRKYIRNNRISTAYNGAPLIDMMSVGAPYPVVDSIQNGLRTTVTNQRFCLIDGVRGMASIYEHTSNGTYVHERGIKCSVLDGDLDCPIYSDISSALRAAEPGTYVAIRKGGDSRIHIYLTSQSGSMVQYINEVFVDPYFSTIGVFRLTTLGLVVLYTN